MCDLDCCRVCGQKRPADAPSGLCPTCLLNVGLAGPQSEIDEVTILFGPASSSVLEAFGEAYGKIPPVLLRDTESSTAPDPVVQVSSEEIPDRSDHSARLQLFGEIARGGMGAVLKGRDADLGRDLAVKILLESHCDKPDMVRRFIEEAQIAGQLQHPGIVPVYELGAFGDRRPYFAMKLVKGQTLATILANRASPGDGLPRLLSIFESICQTMAYAHARGVIHRDLKPSNVMVGSYGEVQVMDWGLAKVLPRGGAVEDASAGKMKDHATVIATARSEDDLDLSQPGSVLGTPAYMAPEQARGELDDVDERADVFALGSIFCELLTGQPAFTGRNGGEIQRTAARGDLADALTRIDRTDHGHDPELIALAKSCLAPERDDRPRNASEIANRMSLYHSRVQERLRQSEIACAEEKARAEEVTKRATVERHRFRLTMALAVSVLALVLTGGGGWAYVSQQRANRQAATERIVAEAIDKATLLRGQAKAAPIDDLSKWPEALAAANEARASMEAGEPSDAIRLRVEELLATLETEHADAVRRAEELDKDLKFFDRLDAIKVESVDREEHEKADAAYASAFCEFGVDVDLLGPTEAGRLFRLRAKPQEFAMRLDDWSLIRKKTSDEPNAERWKCLILAAQATDEDGWRNALRSLIGQADHEAIRRLADDENELSKQDSRSLYLLASVLLSARSPDHSDDRKEAIELLKRAWRLSPNDYSICRKLCEESERELDRVRFATAAVSIKPESEYARCQLAQAFLPPNVPGDFNTSFTMVPTSDPFFVRRCSLSDGDSLRRRSFVVPLKSKEGHEISVGPIWNFDPKDIVAISLGDSIAELRAAIRLAPEDLAIHMRLANALVLQGSNEDAVLISSHVAQADPQFSQFIHGLPRTFYLKGEIDQAIELLQQEIKRGCNEHLCYGFLGNIYHALGKKHLAFSAYREEFARSREKFLESAGLERLLDTGTPEEVIGVLREQIKIPPNCIELHEALAGLFERQGNVEESNAELDKLFGLLRESLQTKEADRTKFGMICLRRGQRQEAIAQFQRLVKLDPMNPGLVNTIAWNLATAADPKLRDGILAVEFATKSCEMTEWNESMYLDTLAASYAESGDFDTAVNWQTKAIELHGNEKEKEDFRERLKLYQDKKPFHSPRPPY